MPDKNAPHFLDAKMAEISTRYQAGESLKSIAPSFSTTAKSVQDAMRRHDIATRPISKNGRKYGFKMKYPMSVERRAKIGAASKGRLSGNKGHHHPHTAEELAKMRGPNHWCYRDGRGNEPYGSGWKRLTLEIRKRDDYLCQHPGCYLPENGKKHECHHIDRDKKNNNPVNLILLCFEHHGKTKKGNTESWQELYEAVQAMRGIS